VASQFIGVFSAGEENAEKITAILAVKFQVVLMENLPIEMQRNTFVNDRRPVRAAGRPDSGCNLIYSIFMPLKICV
jgi:hypothetical protein